MTEKQFQCNGFGNAYINAPIEAHEKISKQLVTCKSPDEPYPRIKGYKHQTRKLKRKTVENKRFTVPDKYQFSHSKVQLNGEPLTNAEIVRLLNVNDGAFVENFNLKKENKELKQSNKDAWNLIQYIYNEIKEDGYMDWGRIQDLVEFEI